ncbi:M23 family metallopeptidase [Sphingomonas sp. BK580]|uniref:M23 family metallopeptidase n=1 Tax=Sphingomonas sp. BK580 TaxID=2586972 RepID=UPI0016117CEB|nr:M23 family metallopeptidase [Sphingomonas sp. BK580]MBB3692197.1 murein DD-endopeptidase MepM/ murein hydrolase activator NlpD [Sphingomonas sp. BK580]
MTKLGWGILALIVVAVAGFVSLLEPHRPGRGDGGAPTASATPAMAPTPVAAVPGKLLVPVAGVARAALRSSWGDARGGGTRGHQGLDIMAPAGTPVLAAADGHVDKLFQSGLGGTTVYQRSADGAWEFYYAHLSGYAPGLTEGQAVRAGQVIAYVGDTGDAAAGNYHLHFGLSRMPAGARWWQGEPLDPFPYLAVSPANR